jgi:phosphoglycerate kinase
LLDAPVAFVDDCVGVQAREAAFGLADREVLLLENLRFHPEEEANDPTFALQLAGLGELFVNDAFGAAHRAHASTEGVAHLLPAAAGLLLEREVSVLEGLLREPDRPFVAVVGGVKVADKIGVLDRLVEIADTVLIGGAMAFTFIIAEGGEVGASLHEDEEGQEIARLARDRAAACNCDLLLPSDVIAADRFHVDAMTRVVSADAVPAGWMGLDIGPVTVDVFVERIASAATVLWNGPMGAFEMSPFSTGTRRVAEAICANGGTTVIGGGDSVAALMEFGDPAEVTHVSTGGGASLELLEGRELPGVVALSEAP